MTNIDTDIEVELCPHCGNLDNSHKDNCSPPKNTPMLIGEMNRIFLIADK